VREWLLFNDDLHFLYRVVAGFWEGAGHGLGYAVSVDCPTAKVVLARARGLQQHRPVDYRVGDRPAFRFACGVELARDWREVSAGKVSAPMFRGWQDVHILPLGFGKIRIVFRERLALWYKPVLDFFQAGHTYLCEPRYRHGLAGFGLLRGMDETGAGFDMAFGVVVPCGVGIV